MRDHDFEREPFVVIQRESAGIGGFLLGAALGVGAALLLAPRTGAETRRVLSDTARRAGDTMRDAVSEMTDTVVAQAADMREIVADRVDSARDVVRRGQDQMLDALDAGRSAAHEARVELERKIAENKTYRRGSASDLDVEADIDVAEFEIDIPDETDSAGV